MQRRAGLGASMRYGLTTLCVGVGQGEATLIERI
jgi:acetyl-CoA C-acetyltransferase